MAIVAAITTQKSVNMATGFATNAQAFLTAMTNLRELVTEQSKTAIDLTASDATYAATNGLQHITGAQLNNLIASITAIQTFLDTNNHTNNFQLVRP